MDDEPTGRGPDVAHSRLLPQPTPDGVHRGKQRPADAMKHPWQTWTHRIGFVHKEAGKKHHSKDLAPFPFPLWHERTLTSSFSPIAPTANVPPTVGRLCRWCWATTSLASRKSRGTASIQVCRSGDPDSLPPGWVCHLPPASQRGRRAPSRNRPSLAFFSPRFRPIWCIYLERNVRSPVHGSGEHAVTVK